MGAAALCTLLFPSSKRLGGGRENTLINVVSTHLCVCACFCAHPRPRRGLVAKLHLLCMHMNSAKQLCVCVCVVFFLCLRHIGTREGLAGRLHCMLIARVANVFVSGYSSYL